MEDVLVFSQPSWLTHQDHFLKVLACSAHLKRMEDVISFLPTYMEEDAYFIERQSIMSPVQKMIHIPLCAMQVKCTQKRVLHCYERMKRNIIRKRKKKRALPLKNTDQAWMVDIQRKGPVIDTHG